MRRHRLPVVDPPQFRLEQPGAGRRGTVIHVVGEVDIATVGALRSLLHAAITDRGAAVVDLSGCRFIDSTVVLALLEADRMLAPARLVVVAPVGGEPERILRLVLGERLELCERLPGDGPDPPPDDSGATIVAELRARYGGCVVTTEERGGGYLVVRVRDGMGALLHERHLFPQSTRGLRGTAAAPCA